MPTILFSKQSIEQLPTPQHGERCFYNDQRLSGLQLMITCTGSKSFKVTRRRSGRLLRITLGKYPEMTVELARKKACDALAQIADGKNPNDAKRKLRAEITFGEMVTEYFD